MCQQVLILQRLTIYEQKGKDIFNVVNDNILLTGAMA